jgi:hypothetical protein
MVDGGEHTAEVGRLLAYIASAGGEGIAAPTDCAVVESAIPDSNVHITTGAVVALNRFPGGNTQSYVMRNVGDTVVALTPQGSTGGRCDLVAVVVEDPQYPGQPDPVDIATGPYVRIRVYENVDPDTRSLSEIDPNQTGYALALVNFNVSDGTVTQSDIVDLRQLVAPRTHTWKRMYNEKNQAADGAGAFAMGTVPAIFPIGASWDVEVPLWANKMQMSASIANMRIMDNQWGANNLQAFSFGYNYIRIGGLTGEVSEWVSSFNNLALGYMVDTFGTQVASEHDVPEEMRGTVQHVDLMGYKDPASVGHNVGSEWGTCVIIEFNFYEEPGF